MVCECRILLSGWSIISKYICKFERRNNPFCIYTFQISIKNFYPIEDLVSLKNCFSISVLMRDHILILIWDIEICSSHGLDEFSETINKKDSVIIICIILH